jgi:hypothetical protein
MTLKNHMQPTPRDGVSSTLAVPERLETSSQVTMCVLKCTTVHEHTRKQGIIVVRWCMSIVQA